METGSGMREQLPDNLLSGDPFGLGIVVAHNAVAQHFDSDSLYVLYVGRVLALHGGMGLGTHDKILRRTGTGAPREVFGGKAGGVVVAMLCITYGRTSGGDKTYSILAHVVGYWKTAYDILILEDFVS